jgi:hypothetical protein
MRYSGPFSVELLGSGGELRVIGNVDGVIEKEAAPFKGYTLVGHVDDKMGRFCDDWFLGDVGSRHLKITHAPSNSVWQGQFLPKTINDDVVTLLSAGEVIEILK